MSKNYTEKAVYEFDGSPRGNSQSIGKLAIYRGNLVSQICAALSAALQAKDEVTFYYSQGEGGSNGFSSGGEVQVTGVSSLVGTIVGSKINNKEFYKVKDGSKYDYYVDKNHYEYFSVQDFNVTINGKNGTQDFLNTYLNTIKLVNPGKSANSSYFSSLGITITGPTSVNLPADWYAIGNNVQRGVTPPHNPF